MKVTKNEALELLSCNITLLAELLEISTQAISQWPDHEIPLAREYQIRDLASGKQPIKRYSELSI
jgi:phage terminase Nu1 subunit (DNA packaging protein)